MKLKTNLIVVIVFCVAVQLEAQEMPKVTGLIPDKVGVEYLNSVGDQAVIFNGKEQIAYDLNYTNHPYFLTSEYVPGDLWYNQVLYKDIPLRLDLYRDEIVTHMPGTPYNIIIEKEKATEALIGGYRVIRHEEGLWLNVPKGNYLILLYDGHSPVVKKYLVASEQRIVDQHVEYTFRLRERFYVNKDGVCYPVSNKGSVLKLFPDKKKELAAYIKQHKLNFRKEREQSIVAVVAYYNEILNR